MLTEVQYLRLCINVKQAQIEVLKTHSKAAIRHEDAAWRAWKRAVIADMYEHQTHNRMLAP